MTPTTKPLILVDADVVAFRAAAAVEPPEVDWGDGTSAAPDVDHSEAIDAASRLVEQIQSEVYGALVMCASDSSNFRKSINPSYKSNRDDREPPRFLSYVHDWLASNFRYERWPNLEADDVIGIMSNPDYAQTHNTIIVSPDKDFKTLPGRFFWRIWTKEEEDGVNTTGYLPANLELAKQILMGDSTDGYYGVPRVGVKGASKRLSEWSIQWHNIGRELSDEGFLSFVWSCIMETYGRAGLSVEDAKMNARMARILRGPDEYDMDTGEVVLWKPEEGEW